MITLENDILLVEIAEKGAEVQKLYHKAEGFDYLWNGDETYWNRHAPHLFPIVGRLNENKYKKGTDVYDLSQHGFARDQVFEVTEQSDEKAVFTLKANEETRAVYPYEFAFSVIHTLEGNKLTTTYQVENLSAETMPFSVGGHPAFNVPLNQEGSFEDYVLILDPLRDVVYYESDPLPYITGRIKPFVDMKHGLLNLNHETFRDTMYIIEEPALKSVTLKPELGGHGVTVHVAEFPHVVLWTKHEQDAPFICIEPCYGLPDIAGPVGQLEDKPGIILLEPAGTKQLSYTIETF